MAEGKNPMFSDRRKKTDRRQQDLPMPAGLDRRVSSRRSRHFQAQPWWLRIDYAVELVSEKKTPREKSSTKKQQPATPPPATKKSD